MNSLQYHRPTVLGPSPQRLRVPAPRCEDAPSVTIEAVAGDITSRSTLKKYSGDVTHVRAGVLGCNLTHEHERGWPLALRLVEGERYQVKAFKCVGPIWERDQLPLDERTVDGLVFYSFARESKLSRDEADGRVWKRGYVSIWTDSLMLTVSNTDPLQHLEPLEAYRVEIKRLPAAS